MLRINAKSVLLILIFAAVSVMAVSAANQFEKEPSVCGWSYDGKNSLGDSIYCKNGKCFVMRKGKGISKTPVDPNKFCVIFEQLLEDNKVPTYHDKRSSLVRSNNTTCSESKVSLFNYCAGEAQATFCKPGILRTVIYE